MNRALRHLAAGLFSVQGLQRASIRARSCFDSLERRTLLSGAVSASVHDGNLILQGDRSANVVVLDQAGLKAGQVRITGVGSTTINKKTEAVIVEGVTRGVGVRLAGGADSVTIKDLSVAGGIWVGGDEGFSILSISNVKVGESLNIQTETTAGSIQIENTTVGEHLKISTESSAETVALRAVDVHGKTRIGTGGGADVLTIDDSTLRDRVTIWTGEGDDVVQFDSNGSASGQPTLLNGKVHISMRGGNDTLQFGMPEGTGNQSIFAARTLFDGGSGTNRLVNVVAGKSPGTKFWIRNFESETRTNTGADTTAPSVRFTSPSNGSTDVARNSNLSATFSEAMNPLTISAATVTVTAPGDVAVSGTVNYSGNVMTFTPQATFAADTIFSVKISTGAQDVAGNALADNFAWSFTTGATSDTAAPTVSGTDPADGATNVPLNKKLTATFSESMDPTTITSSNVTVATAGGAAVAGTVNYVGTIMTFTPSAPLSADTGYTVTISSGAKDAAGNSLASDFVWNFTTGATADTTAPTVTATDPANLKTNVAINKQIAATFSESMDPLTLVDNFSVTGPGNTAVDGTTNYNSLTKTATFTPTSNLAPNTEFTVTIPSGTNGAKDTAGNSLQSDKVWTFTTGTQIAQAPIILGRAAPFAVMATASISSTGATQINGDVGLNPGSSQGIPPSQVNGNIHVTDQTIKDAQTDLLAAYNDAVSRTVTSQTLPGNMGGLTFTPGLYTNSTSVLISGAGPSNNVTLDAQGDPNAVFIFKIGSTLTTGPGAQVILSGGAKASNIFWQVGTSATLNTTTIFKGSILAAVTITVNNGAVVEGRLLGGSNSDGSVTVNASTITVPAA